MEEKIRRPIIHEEPGRFELYCHNSPPTSYPEETHRTIQVCVPLERALYSVVRQSEAGRNLVHQLGARDILVLPIGQPHSVVWRRTADIVSLQLSERFVAEALDIPKLKLADTFTLRDPFISTVARELRQSLVAGGPPSPAFAEAVATLIAYRVGMAGNRNGVVGIGRTIQAFSSASLDRIERYIADHLDQRISLSDLASQVNVSLWHFIRRFHASHGISPHAYIAERRFDRARRLLAESRMSITEIAIEVGMSHSHFSRSFLKRFGVSPSEFRTDRKR